MPFSTVRATAETIDVQESVELALFARETLDTRFRLTPDSGTRSHRGSARDRITTPLRFLVVDSHHFHPQEYVGALRVRMRLSGKYWYHLQWGTRGPCHERDAHQVPDVVSKNVALSLRDVHGMWPVRFRTK